MAIGCKNISKKKELGKSGEEALTSPAYTVTVGRHRGITLFLIRNVWLCFDWKEGYGCVLDIYVGLFALFLSVSLFLSLVNDNGDLGATFWCLFIALH